MSKTPGSEGLVKSRQYGLAGGKRLPTELISQFQFLGSILFLVNADSAGDA
jgi:hypothetical protein